MWCACMYIFCERIWVCCAPFYCCCTLCDSACTCWRTSINSCLALNHSFWSVDDWLPFEMLTRIFCGDVFLAQNFFTTHFHVFFFIHNCFFQWNRWITMPIKLSDRCYIEFYAFWQLHSNFTQWYFPCHLFLFTVLLTKRQRMVPNNDFGQTHLC